MTLDVDESTFQPYALATLAKECAQRQSRVFPLHAVDDGHCSCKRAMCIMPGKHPRHTDWFQKATTQVTQISKWWKQWPEANVGVVSAIPGEFLVIDPNQPLPDIDGHETLYMPSDKFFQGAQRMFLSADQWNFSSTDVPYYVDQETDLVYSYRGQRGMPLAEVAAANRALQENMSVLDPRTSLVYIISMAKWIEAKRNGTLTPAGDVAINVDDILDLKARVKFKKGGYRFAQKKDISDRFRELGYFEVDGPNPNPRAKNRVLRGAMVNVAFDDERDITGARIPFAFHVKPGSAVWEFFDGQFGLCDFFASLARLDASQGVGRIAYQIGLYLVFQYRIRESYQNFDQPLRIQTILDGARVRVESETRHYTRFRDQVEAALDRLKSDGVLDNWQYVSGDEERLPTRGWYRKWLTNRIQLTVPAMTIRRAKIRATNRHEHLADKSRRPLQLAR